VARLILDTGALIAGVRGRLDLGELADGDDVAMPAIVMAEYRAGVLLDGDRGRAAAQRAFLEEVLDVVPVIDYDEAVADQHASLLAHSRAGGRRRGPHDLIVAATARATERVLLTTDRHARFDELPGVRCRLVASAAGPRRPARD
jgi:tRNA(fMet)-specific endonuclease VapC